MKENNTMKKEQIKIGDSVIVNGIQVKVDEIIEETQYWGIDQDGDEIGFTSEQVMAIVPE